MHTHNYAQLPCISVGGISEVDTHHFTVASETGDGGAGGGGQLLGLFQLC